MTGEEILPFTSMWTVCESERLCLFFAVQVYAPWSVLLSTWCSTSVPFGYTSWRRLVGSTFPSAGSRGTFFQFDEYIFQLTDPPLRVWSVINETFRTIESTQTIVNIIILRRRIIWVSNARPRARVSSHASVTSTFCCVNNIKLPVASIIGF